jgi:transposase
MPVSINQSKPSDSSYQASCQLLFLPPYSPELNPIEQTWASFKRYIKRFRHQFDSLIETIDFIFQNINTFYGMKI